ncbi:MAG: formate--tetrahydrofolate ligase [Elusimicrobia bacterium]|nr:MAG: formate--tetrahydrofolate ligase [Elusimicrobiota bacterium]KAF0155483.1 MAG: formate--tetrahydrofolate ligase [Elusimicrobiota bacterium]
MPTDIEIARKIKLRHIREIAEGLGVPEEDLYYHGKYKAKLPLRLIDREKAGKSKVILVSAISPTPAGEGKTTVSIGLSLGLNRIGKKTTVVLREPSLGPVFGVKGGATGGGWSQVLPMEDINLHFTGDFAAIEKAHNLLAAVIDNNIQNKKSNLGIDPRTVAWRRVMDMNDRSLRKIIVGLGGTMSGVPRETGFDIVAASEVMAILCLSEDITHLKEKLGNIFVGYTYDRKPVYARDLKANGAMAALLKDALMPNLVQTSEGTPAIIHGGPFANIAHGCNSIIATRMGMTLSDYVVTEAGFAFELGAEKFLDIKCRYAGIAPAAAVLVATVRALKYHGGADLKEIKKPDPARVAKGLENLEKHVENMKQFKLSPVVAVNRFADDTEEEISVIRERCAALGVPAAVADVWGQGGRGAEELARLVLKAADCCPGFEPIYDWGWPVKKKIEAIAGKMYGAKHIDYTARAKKDLEKIAGLGLEGLPVCIAKTQKSLSDNPELIGRPKDFVVTVREIEVAAGAGFLIPITGDIMRMPGLPEHPASENMDIDADGNVTGLF